MVSSEDDVSQPIDDRGRTTSRGRASDGGHPNPRLSSATWGGLRPIRDDGARTIQDGARATSRIRAIGDARRSRPILDARQRVPRAMAPPLRRPPSRLI